MNPITGEQIGNTVKILSRIVENYDLVIYYKNASQYWVWLLDGQGKSV